ncbi:PQQ-like beta-propeller repeat protein [Natronococcus sp. A-GB1]|uniref:PQQ-binding-like beta-propeller repeat protein n=1 Tax=Natronococcus sp. A-GB1 TaxID=3037648 RepID=UPI00241F1FAF|nr:PQQ-binding-like beta-propeller repeat protein [Natronococcus sp. A-GB1]MDG5758541.1 PQQ-like beta-propeller repeat protein [Natronococcus sp. A-GB1]
MTGLFGSLSTAADEHGESNEESGEGGDGSADFTRPDGVAWRYDGPHDIESTTVEGDRLYTGSDGTVYAIDTADGSLLWETSGVGTDGTPAVDGETVYVVGDRIHALDVETGETQWESEVESDGMAVDHGMVYTSSEGTVYALDTEDGSVVWQRDELTVERENGGDPEEETLESLSMGDTDENWVYVFEADSWGREAVGLDPATGETREVVGPIDGVSSVIADSGYLGVQPPYDSTLLVSVSSAENLGGVHPSVDQTFNGGWYFGATRHNTIAAYDLSAGGERAWEMDYPQSLPQVVGNTAVVLYGPSPVQDSPEESEDEDRVVASDLQTGDEQWRYVFDEREWTAGGGPSTALTADENTVYVSRHGELLALRSEDDEDEEDSEDEEAEPQDVEVEYVYEIAENAYGDDEHVEERLELSSGEYYLDEQEDGSNYCHIEFEAENVTDDEAITIYFEGRVNDSNTHERPEELEPGESISLSLRGIEECPADPDLVEVRAWAPDVGEPDEPPEDEEDEEEADDDEEDEEEADDEPTDEADLDLSVSAPDSIPYEETADPSEDAADFCITVTNHGDETVSVDGQFDIGPIDEPLPLELEPGETETAYYGVMSRDLGPGDHDWTVTANGETETGTLTVTDDEEC